MKKSQMQNKNRREIGTNASLSLSKKSKKGKAVKRRQINKQRPYEKRSKKQDDEEISSEDDESVIGNDTNHAEPTQYSSDEETAQDIRVRKSKAYLAELQEKAADRGEDIGGLLRTEILSSIDKLKLFIAEKVKGYSSEQSICIKHKKQQNFSVCSFALSADNKFIFVGAKSKTVLKWDLEANTLDSDFEVKPINEPGKKARCRVIAMCTSSDGKFLALSVGSKCIQIWCPVELKHLKTFYAHRDVVTALTIPKDSHDLYSASKDRSVCVWSLDEMALVESLHGHEAGITSIDSLNRDRVITSGGYDCTLRIFKITESLQAIYCGHHDGIEMVKFASKSNFLSSGMDGALSYWDVAKKKPLHTLSQIHGKHKNGIANWITSLAVVPNSDLIATGSCDGFIRLWRICSTRKLERLLEIPLEGHINQLAFNSNGTKIYAAVGKEHKCARYEKISNAKNAIFVFTLEMAEDDNSK